MTGHRAITLHQPWATLIALGVKMVETRSRRMSYRGPVAIHAAKRHPEWDTRLGSWHVRPRPDSMPGPMGDPMLYDEYDDSWHELPLGKIVASANVAGCVPMVNASDSITEPGQFVHLLPRVLGEGRVPWLCEITPDGEYRDLQRIEDQKPYGTWADGRWAILLDEIAPTSTRCPACWGGFRSPLEGCSVCRDVGQVIPIPARGNQAMPWHWDPTATTGAA